MKLKRESNKNWRQERERRQERKWNKLKDLGKEDYTW